MRLACLFLCLFVAASSSGCAELRAGWVKVEFLDGAVPAEAACAFKVNADGSVEAICTAIHPGEPSRELLWKREKKRSSGGPL